MAKKPNISKEAQVLLKLLRIALGTEPRKYFGEVVEPFPEGIDWKEVVRMSYEHKVSALAVDGLEASKYDPYKGLDEKQTEELKTVLVPWVKDVENTEWSYCYYVEVLKTLCQIFRDNGLTPIILKGYGLSLNYPRPSHRGAGDIDIFLIDKDGKPAAEEGNRIAREVLGVEIEQEDDEHHSSFSFKGITVENHYDLVKHCRNVNHKAELEQTMMNLLTNGYKEKDQLFFPSDTFNAVYLMQHLASHFKTFNVTYRQFCDYSSFITKSDDVNWTVVQKVIGYLNLKEFSNGIFCMLISDYGIEEPTFMLETKYDSHFVACLYQAISIERVPKSNWFRYVCNYLSRRWVFNYFYGRNILTMILCHFQGRF